MTPSRKSKSFSPHGSNQRRALNYIYQRILTWRNRTFNAVELAKFLGITRQGAWKLLRTLAAKGYLHCIGKKRIDIPSHLQLRGWTHYFVLEFIGIFGAIAPLLRPDYKKIEPKSLPTNFEIVLRNKIQSTVATYKKSIADVKEFFRQELRFPEWIRRNRLMVLLGREPEMSYENKKGT